MTNEYPKSEMAAIIEDFEAEMVEIARIGAERARIIGRASVRGKRIGVAVNAEGTIIEIKFASGIEDLSYGEIAKGVTEAAQRAQEDAARQARELMAPLLARRSRLPKLSDLVDGMPDLTDRIPKPPLASTAPPGAPEREESTAAGDFPQADQGVTETGW
ncbi:MULTISPECIES: YbaB/EbfC family nucleoid-associated protein [unclassified Nocardia]|uniref:YbaB/EbfC family nucleoid-associated protein n=1 Tax=unclassified Nocardia TaxID=2637762 RepID=UPI001CE44DF9|nr:MULTISPECIES: YbaB/EbfC family nucleoid-associated protein [unclassified Nocardia]